jgi:hypothetical protein
VAVSESRQIGIENLLQLKQTPQLILLDDAFQPRQVKAGFYIFGSGIKYENNMFLALNKAFKPKTINKQKIYVSNAMYFINKALSENTLKLEL